MFKAVCSLITSFIQFCIAWSIMVDWNNNTLFEVSFITMCGVFLITYIRFGWDNQLIKFILT